MDVLAELLHGARARGALIGRSVLSPPWALRLAAGAALTVVTPLRGRAWVVPDGGGAVRLGTGDVAVVRGPGPFTLADPPATPPRTVAHDAEHRTASGGVAAGAEPERDGLARQDGESGAALLLTGGYRVRGHVNERLLSALPAVVTVAENEADCPLTEQIAAEVVRDGPGRQVILDRLLDLLLMFTLRTWFARAGTQAPPWYRALGDPVAGPALRALHDAPARQWTVASLAEVAGVSRATMARRFTALVGTPPMTYLADWRVCLAADLLADTTETIDSIARRVGYANAFALSVAFKRVRGVSPSEHRAHAAVAAG
ncbi:AraC family transcriptional regulator [Marinactinospora rubrisoli]|uniref:AraC family transcriptional regulator n=1 Tax=Marinactinospora rubrisoli TaxID=2715399 RepID=A0ABW2KLR0_9ACTN